MSKTALLGVSSRGQGAETILFLNGFGTDQKVWDHQVEHFVAAGRRTVTLDYVGAGRSQISEYSAERYATLYDHVDDVLGVIDELAIDRVSIVGHSVGAMIGALVAISLEDRCRRLVMIGASPRYLDAPGYRGGFSQEDIDALSDAMGADYQAWASGFSHVISANPQTPSLATAYAALLQSIRPDIAQSSLRMIFLSDMRDVLPKVKVPTLVVQASDDIAVPPEVADYLAATIRQARLFKLHYSGHLPHMLAPEATTAIIDGFLNEPD